MKTIKSCLKLTMASMLLLPVIHVKADSTSFPKPLMPTNHLENSPACQAFKAFATEQKVDPKYPSYKYKNLAPLKTDGLVVIKDGKLVYEWYDGVVQPQSPHVQWSATKMITATLLARAIQEGVTYQGEKVSLKTPLKTFFPEPGLLKINPADKDKYEKITLENLVEMSANFNWNETYGSGAKGSTFIPMLYMQGQKNMADYALKAPMNPEGPGNRWVYSGGNMVILMAVLKKIYGDDYAQMPQKLLAEPLGLENFKIETDASGTFVGSSYAYMTLKDMAKIGQLYLQNGKWKNQNNIEQELLPQSWVKEASEEVSPAVFNENTSLPYIKDLGAPSRRIFWLNKDIYREDGLVLDKSNGKKILYPREMPQAPSDMYFAAGHYGQLIIIIPSQNLVIARTGYDEDYWDHVQPLAVKALSCLNPDYKPDPVKSLLPPRAGEKPSWFESSLVGRIGNTVGQLVDKSPDLAFVYDMGIAGSKVSKEMCSFLFTMQAAKVLPGDQLISSYKDRTGLDSTLQFLLFQGWTFSVDVKNQRVLAQEFVRSNNKNSSKQNRFFAATYSDEHPGCRWEQLK